MGPHPGGGGRVEDEAGPGVRPDGVRGILPK